MKIKSGFFCILLILSLNASAQNSGRQDSLRLRNFQGEVLKPTIALGTGILSFYGDITHNTLNHPFVNRIGSEITITSQINSFLEFNFYLLFGKIAANERSLTRNLNFESEIRSGGVFLSYNFDHFLPKYRQIEPYFLIGIEHLEFLSKTDRFDSKGNLYHYWKDGSIRSSDENSHLASEAKILQRDYTYETDIRESNADGFGHYNESSFSVPIGLGLKMKLSSRVNFKIGPTFHYTFTDFLDGISENSLSNRKGQKGNDKFLMTSFSLSYDMIVNKRHSTDFEDFSPEEDQGSVDYLALYMADSDNDGVRDFIDKCPNTPFGVKVDKNGCPIDIDNDGVPNYLDDEFDSPSNVFVTTNGLELTDDVILQMYRAYQGFILPLDHQAMQIKKETIYAVQLGVFKDGKIPEETINKLLNVPDLVSVQLPDNSTAFIVGDYKSPVNALNKKNIMVEYGINEAKIVEIKKNKENAPSKILDVNETQILSELTNVNETSIATNAYTKSSDPKVNATVNSTYKNYADDILIVNKKEDKIFTTSTKNTIDIPSEYRVVLGAYTKGIPPYLINKFLKIPNILPDKINDSITVYSTGKYSDLANAINKKSDLVKSGVLDAKVVQYKNGKYVPVTQEQLAQLAKNTSSLEKIQGKNITAINKKIGTNELDISEYQDESFANYDPRDVVVFRVQLGAYKKKLSRNIFKGVAGVIELTMENKLTKYLSGSYTNYEEATKQKIEMIIKGFEDAFIVAYKNGVRVPINTVGVKYNAQENLDESKPFNAINKSYISYKIEIGTFIGELPADEVKKLGPLVLEVERQITMEGKKRYTLGSFSDYMSALIYKNQIAKKHGLGNVNVVAFFKEEQIPVQEALDLTE